MKKFLRPGLLIVVAILMTGCVKLVTTVNEDGSGTWEIAILFSQDALLAGAESGTVTDTSDALFSLLSGESITDEPSDIVFIAEERLRNGHNWIYVTGTINSIEGWAEVGDAFERVFPEDDSSTLTLNTASPNVTISDGIIRVEVNLIADEAQGTDAGNDPFSSFVQTSFEFSLPGELIDHNGTIDPLTGNPVWVISGDSQEDAHFFAESRIE